MLCEVPLTKEQQEFAAEHHGLVYKFLNDNHLPDDEFYDVVIFPYLKAVQDYFSDESAQRYGVMIDRPVISSSMDHFFFPSFYAASASLLTVKRRCTETVTYCS